MMSAVSGSTTVKPNTPRNSGGQTGLLAVSFSRAETQTRITGAIAKIHARLRPMVARIVSRRITRLTTPERDRPARWPDPARRAAGGLLMAWLARCVTWLSRS